jgi:hypothetical protein
VPLLRENVPLLRENVPLLRENVPLLRENVPARVRLLEHSSVVCLKFGVAGSNSERRLWCRDASGRRGSSKRFVPWA